MQNTTCFVAVFCSIEDSGGGGGGGETGNYSSSSVNTDFLLYDHHGVRRETLEPSYQQPEIPQMVQ